MEPARVTQEIACQQVLLEDSSVFSIQWSDIPEKLAAGITADLLLERYLGYIRRCTFAVIRPCRQGSGIEFRFFGSGISLITFLPPLREEGATVLRICGGLLVQPRQCERGELRFSVEQRGDTVRLSLQLSEYCPLLLGSPSPSAAHRWLYRFTQAAIHRLVTVRFLALLYRELAGTAAPVRVVAARVREGRPV